MSHDEGEKEKKQDSDLKFKWKCSEILESFCENIDTPILSIKFSDYKTIISKPSRNLVFEIELILTKDKREAKKNVSFKLQKPIEIPSNKNDLDITNLITITPSNSGAEKDITFILSFDIPSLKFSDYRYEWTIKSFKNNNQYLNTRNENSLKVYNKDLFLGINEIYLKIVNKNTNKIYSKVYYYLKPIPPYGGRCEVFPQNGISLKDDFHFKISNWITNNKPLLYKIKFLGEDNNLIDISLGGFLDEEFITKNLPVGEKYFLEAIDSAGLSETIPCYLKVLPNKNLLSLEDYLEKIFDPLKKSLIIEIYKSNTKTNGNKKSENEIDPRIAINDQQIQILYNLLSSGEDLSDNIQNVIVSLLKVTPEPYSDNKILTIFDSFEIIINKIDLVIKNNEMIKNIYEIGDNLSQRINTSKEINSNEKDKSLKLITEIQKFYTVINEKLFGNIVSGQSLEIKTPAIDIKLTKASIINVPVVSMEYENEKRFKKFNRKNNNKNKIKVRHLQNNDLECDLDFSAICLNKEKMKSLMNSTGVDKIGFKGELNKNVTLPIKEEQFSNSINFYFTDEDEGNKNRILSENKVNFDFEVRLKLPRDKEIGDLGPATCVQYEKEKKNAETSCDSFYDLTAKEIVCKCQRQGLTVNIKDKILAQISKLKQFPPLLDHFCKNYFILLNF